MFNNNHFVALYAISKNNVLGGNGKMLWHHKGDFRWFKGLTKGHAVIMGRKTFESLPNGALVHRINIVVTRNKDYKAKDCIVVHSLAEAARYVMRNHPGAIQYVIGGKELLDKALAYCTGAYVTHIGKTVDTEGVVDLVMAPHLPSTFKITNAYELPSQTDKNECKAVVHAYEQTGPIKSIFD